MLARLSDNLLTLDLDFPVEKFLDCDWTWTGF